MSSDLYSVYKKIMWYLSSWKTAKRVKLWYLKQWIIFLWWIIIITKECVLRLDSLGPKFRPQ